MSDEANAAIIRSVQLRKVGVIVLGVPACILFIVLVLQYKGLIEVENHGITESTFFIVGFGLVFLLLGLVFLVWRCPACRGYLGKEFNHSACPHCQVPFSADTNLPGRDSGTPSSA
jgi:hypothetical protein